MFLNIAESLNNPDEEEKNNDSVNQANYQCGLFANELNKVSQLVFQTQQIPLS